MNESEAVRIRTMEGDKLLFDRAWVHESGDWVTGWIDKPNGRVKQLIPRHNVQSIKFPDE